MKTVTEAILEEDEVIQDIIWSILKRRDEKFGILKKLRCIARILDLDEDIVLSEAKVDDNGRFLDSPNRDLIHDALIQWANNK